MDIATLIISGITIVISLFSLYKSDKASKKAQESSNKSIDISEIQNLISTGSLEITIAQNISDSKNRVQDLSINISDYIAKQKTNNITQEELIKYDIYKKVYNAALENNLNAYEEACAKYLDAKIDKIRFKKSYKKEITNLVEKETYISYFNPENTSSYQAILKTYREWNVLE